ncbi:unnamed protein product [Ilex paraguariensis]|uniref:Enoyl reductase (ER) domain-containing protein n=1 Tax=Ilex paraguariensis TaxID=185542 RepID=A0ABC8SLF8_9AQUA
MASGGGAAAAAEEVTVVENREWYLCAYAPEGVPTSDHLKLRTVSFSLSADAIPDQHVALRVIYISFDPYLRAKMSGHEDGLYVRQFPLDKGIKAFGMGRVIRSKDIKGMFVAEYSVVPSIFLQKVDPTVAITLPDHLGCFEVLGKPKPRSNVFISAAAGGVGMYAGKLAKLKGCPVIGSTGSDEKSIGNLSAAMAVLRMTGSLCIYCRFSPNGIDVYFDNVGGNMLEAVLNHVNNGARIPVCGMISQYSYHSFVLFNVNKKHVTTRLFNILAFSKMLHTFMIGSYRDRFGDFAKEMQGYIKEGKISFKHKICHGIESFLEGIASMFSSTNIGKVILQI